MKRNREIKLRDRRTAHCAHSARGARAVGGGGRRGQWGSGGLLGRRSGAFSIWRRVHYPSCVPVARTRGGRPGGRASRLAAPRRPLFYCQPTILTCAPNVRSTKVFMEISFRVRLARPLRGRRYKSTITNGRVN